MSSSIVSSSEDSQPDKDRALREKEAELKRMQVRTDMEYVYRAELLTIMIATRFLDLIALFQPIRGPILVGVVLQGGPTECYSGKLYF